MDTKMINDRMKASDLFVKLVREAKEANMTKKDSVLRACEIVKNEAGFDLSDIVQKKQEGYVPGTNDDTYSQIIIDGIKAAINANRRPTTKAIKERKRLLEKIKYDDFQNLIAELINTGEVVNDNKRNPAYYLVNYHSKYSLPRQED